MNSGTFSKLIIIAITLLLLPASQAFAATITTSATCTFTNAWQAAKDNSDGEGCVAVGAYGDDTIILYADAVIPGRDLRLTDGSTITVEGRGFTIDANNNDSHFALNDGSTINLNQVKLTNGRNSTPSVISLSRNSPGITSQATVTITNSVICGNTSTDTRNRFAATIAVKGDRRLTMRNSIVCNNTGLTAIGGAIWAEGFLDISNSIFYGNRAKDGGAFHLSLNHTKTFSHVIITGNTVTGEGAGIFMLNGAASMSNSIVYGNKGGADCYEDNSISTTQFSYGGGGNLIGTNTNCEFPTVSSADPLLVQVQPPGPVSSDANAPHYAYALGAGSPAIDAVDCLTGVTGVSTDLLGRNRPLGSRCDIGAVESIPTPTPTPPTGNGSGSGSGNGNGDDGDSGRGDDGGSSEDRAAMAPTPVRISPAQTCKDLMTSGIMVSNQSPGTACQLVQQPSGYGHRDLAAAMPSSVVDLWGWITPSTKICFQAASGSIRFVDTTVLPRTLSTLPVFSEAGMLCSTIDRAGQVALIADGSPPPTSVPVGQPAERSLSDCMVRATEMLNFRDAPAGQRITSFADSRGFRHNLLPPNAVLTALARTDDWFKVDYHGTQGWIAARYVAPMGLCG